MDKPLIQCVVVLYKQRPDQAKSLVSLIEIRRQDQSIANKVRIFVQDNSPDIQPPAIATFSNEMAYHHDPTNPGLASAYNAALAIADSQGCKWLLLLDQDTVLSRDFLFGLLTAVQSPVAERACAIVPQLIRAGKLLSPHLVRRRSYDPLPIGFSGFTSEPLLPCNSASCLKVQTLISIGGFPQEYWLDFLDYAVFHKLHAAGGHVYVMDAQLEHNLSLHNMEAEVSITRYINMLAAEWMFIRETKPRSDRLLHRLDLFKRALRQVARLRNKAYAWQTLRAALK
jgi:GT2 family glycosyltransferase